MKFTVISKNRAITKHDLIEILSTWNAIYASLCGRWASGEKGLNGMRKVASSLYAIDEIKGTPAGYLIERAAELASKNHPLEKVHKTLCEAEEILRLS